MESGFVRAQLRAPPYVPEMAAEAVEFDARVDQAELDASAIVRHRNATG